MKIVRAETVTLHIPFYTDRVTCAMQRARTHSERILLYRLETDNGIIGYGEYPFDGDATSLVGKNPYAIMNDDSIGFGPQVAVLDVIGKDAGVPVHSLVGKKLRDRCPISWWDIDMPPADWAAEARESVSRGYTSFKMKARPWFDIIEQVDIVGKVVPDDYRFDIDFNGFLLTEARAEIILRELDEHPNVGMYESPFYLWRDLDGASILRERVRKPVVEHFREACLYADCCDGFVVGGTLNRVREVAALAASFNKPFFLQTAGTGISAVYLMHLASVLSHAQLPHMATHELWKEDLLEERLKVVDGYIEVPDGPGLGVEVDEKMVEKYRVDSDEPTPKERYLQQKRILRISWPGAGKNRRVWNFTNETACQQAFHQGDIPGFERGVSLEVVEDDNSASFRKQHADLVARGA